MEQETWKHIVQHTTHQYTYLYDIENDSTQNVRTEETSTLQKNKHERKEMKHNNYNTVKIYNI